jgi:hypothetical protein
MDVVTAAAMLVGIDLQYTTDNTEWEALRTVALYRGAAEWEQELLRAIKARTLLAEKVAIKSPDPHKPSYIDPHTVTSGDLLDSRWCDISEEALAAWCVGRGVVIPRELFESDFSPDDGITYPEELRAALEAFVAVRSTPLRGRSPKAALLAWLETNKPDLSANARERIATVANWQPTGGAPKTPGE